MLKIKFCGMTRREDLLAASRLGVDAIGLVFYTESPRHVKPEQARALAYDLPPFVTKVGVFVEPSAEQVCQMVQHVGLSAVQLYGGPSTRDLRAAGCHVPIIRAVSAGADLADRLSEYRDESVLVDAPAGNLPGGTGQIWDWASLQACPRPRHLILAGGLNADNIREAVLRAKPDGVDVSSGVEQSPGVKDAARMAAFMAACTSFRSG
jgi:phosphoribosylanthranilate isomerase